MNFSKFALNAGELSDEMAGRPDINKVQMGCEVAENVRVLRTGGQTRRAGFKYVADAQTITKDSRLEGFRFSGAQWYVLEFADLKMRVLLNGALVESGGSPLEYTTPWTIDQVFALDFAQRVNSIVVTHPEVEPYEITKNADDTWTVTAFPWQERVWEVGSESIVTLTAAALTGSTTITANSGVFTSDWVGSRLRLSHTRPEKPNSKEIGDVVLNVGVAFNLLTTSYSVGDIIRVDNSSTRSNGRYSGTLPLGERKFWTCIADYDHTTDYTGSTDADDYAAFFDQGIVAVEPQEVSGEWTFETFGTWRAIFAIERSYDGGTTWSPVKVCASDVDQNYLVQDTEDPDANATYRLLILDSDTGTGTTNERFSFTVSSTVINGIAVITAYTSATVVDVTVETDFEEITGTTEWYEDAFNPRNGYPKTCTFHQKRLFFGGSGARPQTIWSSKTRAPYNFTSGTLADEGMVFETEATEYEAVVHLVSHLSLLVGTTTGIWAITSPSGLSLTPENNAISRQVRHGVQEGIMSLPLQNNVIFLQDKGRKVQELTGGSVEYGGYKNVDLTQLASHITRGGVTQMTNGDSPDSTLYMVVGGELANMTYEAAQNVVGWSRWVTDGTIKSIGVTTGANEDDDIYIIVDRDGDRFIEYHAPDMLRIEENNDVENLVFLDSYARKTDVGGFTTIEGLDHLEGRTDVEVFANGEPLGAYTVTSGVITLTASYTDAIAGLPYTSLITPMPLDRGSIGDKISVQELVVRFRNSLGAEITQDEVNWSTVSFVQEAVPEGTDPAPSLYTGDKVMSIHSTWQRKPTISIRQTQPYPMTVLAIRIKGKTAR